ncbi:MAG: hypothetical protein ABIQ74_08570 [Chitinophagales bacterium]
MNISGMIGGFIAAVSAFLLVDFSENVPALMVWLGPTIIGTPLIVYFISFYKKKFTGGKQVQELVTIREDLLLPFKSKFSIHLFLPQNFYL